MWGVALVVVVFIAGLGCGYLLAFNDANPLVAAWKEAAQEWKRSYNALRVEYDQLQGPH